MAAKVNFVGTDKQRRRYLTFREAKAGVVIRLDGDFDCCRPWTTRRLRNSPDGLWFRCAEGKHLLEGQEDWNGRKFYVGVYPVKTEGIESDGT